MTTFMEKPQSKKAKTFERHNGKQDHGDASQRKGHESQGYWENTWESRGVIKADKTHLKEVIRDGLDSYQNPDVLEGPEVDYDAQQVEFGEFSGESDGTQTDYELDHQSDDQHLNFTEAELGVKSRTERRNAEARRATSDDYSEDDFGDDDRESAVHVRRIR